MTPIYTENYRGYDIEIMRDEATATSAEDFGYTDIDSEDAQDAWNEYLAVTDCNRNELGLQSAAFWDAIRCNQRLHQDHITCD
jgi:hypothetical protein